jgi:23S rRNA (cytosine1962-C5)-methyltransferase
LAGHPWLYRDALAPFEAPPGEPVDVFDKRGRLLARGIVESGPIAVRLFTTRQSERVSVELFAQRVREALAPCAFSTCTAIRAASPWLPAWAARVR